MAAAPADTPTLTHILVLDFEATCDRDRSFGPNEIIELPVVFLSTETWEPVAEYHTYVRPVDHPVLTDFATELTGITQDLVDNGILLQDALVGLDAKMREVLGDDAVTAGDSFVFATCGEWDLKTMLPKEAARKGIPLPSYWSRWMNVKKVFASHMRVKKQKGMAAMLNALDMDLIGRHHSGIDDARNIARIVSRLAEDGAHIAPTSPAGAAKRPAKKGRGRNRPRGP